MSRRTAAAGRVLDEASGVSAMTAILAVMLFLTVLAAALGLGMRGAARSLDRQLSDRLTVQVALADPAVRGRQTAAAIATLRALPEVTRAVPVERAALLRLLGPWLGTEASDPELPIPAMIDVDLADGSDAAVARVRAAVVRAAPAAQVDAHERWMAPVAGVMRLVKWLALTLVVLMAGATAAVVMLATRAGLEAHRPTIQVMHMLGSTDVQVARLFQRRIARDAALGGLIGSVAALAVVALLGRQMTALGSDLLASAALGTGSWVLLILLPVLFVLLAAASARVAVVGDLRRTL